MLQQALLQRSEEKPHGGIYVSQCSNSEVKKLFPLNVPPQGWNSCNDAYEYTWMIDEENLLNCLSLLDKQRLARSMGFCPHIRCQLGSTYRNDDLAACPKGLCYSKLQNGAMTFGACCFHDGAFNNGQLIGYARKSQPVAKPIYKHSRVVLDNNKSDESEINFINANEVFPGLIITQCPFKSNAEDVKRLILQRNVSWWLQIGSKDKVSKEGFAFDQVNQTKGGKNHIDCNLLPSLLEDKTLSSAEFDGFYSYSILQNKTQFRWFSDWSDFSSVTDETQMQSLRLLVSEGADVIRDGGTIVVSCYSGRGRSGTFASAVVARLKGINSHEELVRIIVSLRENRDGLVETPRQYLMLTQLLHLPSCRSCNMLCSANRYIESLSSHGEVFQGSMGIIFVFITFAFLFLGYFIGRVPSNKMHRE